ncbi:MAG TPA: hypothetical protein VKE70_12115, partial [Candidatus Solibacter sp.]|nr:hypothetical protein [Candidatus Solibacter sp.]
MRPSNGISSTTKSTGVCFELRTILTHDQRVHLLFARFFAELESESFGEQRLQHLRHLRLGRAVRHLRLNIEA